MADNILEAYLVKVGALPDLASFARLDRNLKDAYRSVDNFAVSAVKSMVKFEVASIGTFTALGLGAISLADKTAMTDQSYRLLGLRMLMTKQSARAMQTSLDQLGATIDEVAYDPELNKRFQQLYEDNLKLQKQLGDGFDKNMFSIRSLRVEYKRFGTEFEILVGATVSKTFEKLGYGEKDFEDRLKDINNWFVSSIPNWSENITSYLIPAWDSAKLVVKDFGDNLNIATKDFIHFTGEISGDKSLENADVTMKSLADTTLKWMDGIVDITLAISLLGKIFEHEFKTFYNAGKVIGDLFLFKGNDAKKDFDATWNEAAKWQGDLAGLLDPKQKEGNPDYARILEHQAEIKARSMPTGDSSMYSSSSPYTYSTGTLDRDAIMKAIFKQESNFNPNAVSSKGAQGIGQLMPSTSKQYGVKDPFNAKQNAEGSEAYFYDLLKRYHGDVSKALAAYNSGPGNVDKYGGVPPFPETQDFVRRVMNNYKTYSENDGKGTIVNGVTINVPHALPEKDWSAFVYQSFHEQTKKKVRNVTAQTAGGPFK